MRTPTPREFNQKLLPKAVKREANELIKRMRECLKNGLPRCCHMPYLEGTKPIVESHFHRKGWKVQWTGLDWTLK